MQQKSKENQQFDKDKRDKENPTYFINDHNLINEIHDTQPKLVDIKLSKTDKSIVANEFKDKNASDFFIARNLIEEIDKDEYLGLLRDSVQREYYRSNESFSTSNNITQIGRNSGAISRALTGVFLEKNGYLNEAKIEALLNSFETFNNAAKGKSESYKKNMQAYQGNIKNYQDKLKKYQEDSKSKNPFKKIKAKSVKKEAHKFREAAFTNYKQANKIKKQLLELNSTKVIVEKLVNSIPNEIIDAYMPVFVNSKDNLKKQRSLGHQIIFTGVFPALFQKQRVRGSIASLIWNSKNNGIKLAVQDKLIERFNQRLPNYNKAISETKQRLDDLQTNINKSYGEYSNNHKNFLDKQLIQGQTIICQEIKEKYDINIGKPLSQQSKNILQASQQKTMDFNRDRSLILKSNKALMLDFESLKKDAAKINDKQAESELQELRDHLFDLTTKVYVGDKLELITPDKLPEKAKAWLAPNGEKLQQLQQKISINESDSSPLVILSEKLQQLSEKSSNLDNIQSYEQEINKQFAEINDLGNNVENSASKQQQGETNNDFDSYQKDIGNIFEDISNVSNSANPNQQIINNLTKEIKRLEAKIVTKQQSTHYDLKSSWFMGQFNTSRITDKQFKINVLKNIKHKCEIMLNIDGNIDMDTVMQQVGNDYKSQNKYLEFKKLTSKLTSKNTYEVLKQAKNISEQNSQQLAKQPKEPNTENNIKTRAGRK